MSGPSLAQGSTDKALDVTPMPNLTHAGICHYLTEDKRGVTGVGMKMEQT